MLLFMALCRRKGGGTSNPTFSNYVAGVIKFKNKVYISFGNYGSYTITSPDAESRPRQPCGKEADNIQHTTNIGTLFHTNINYANHVHVHAVSLRLRTNSIRKLQGLCIACSRFRTIRSLCGTFCRLAGFGFWCGGGLAFA